MTAGAKTRSTRGKSRPGRLRLLDAWLVSENERLLTRRDGAFANAVTVDLGLGAVPWTTRELAAAVRGVAPQAQVLGVDIDPVRVENSQRFRTPGLSFAVGGFELAETPPLRLIRVMNVLRQYRPDEIPAAHAALCRAVLPGGLVIEGSSSKRGETLTAHLLAHAESGETDSLLLATDFSAGFAPRIFAGCLPRALRGKRQPRPTVAAFLDAWTSAWSRMDHRDPATAFASSAEQLPDVRVGPGWLVWTPPQESSTTMRNECGIPRHHPR